MADFPFKRGAERGKLMGEIWIFLVIVGVWVALQAYILPKLGVST
jgi:hypothetical protein